MVAKITPMIVDIQSSTVRLSWNAAPASATKAMGMIVHSAKRAITSLDL